MRWQDVDLSAGWWTVPATSSKNKLASGGIPQLTISKILNHVERNITAVYDRHSYDPEKRAALDWWDVKLRAILDNKTARKCCRSSDDVKKAQPRRLLSQGIIVGTS